MAFNPWDYQVASVFAATTSSTVADVTTNTTVLIDTINIVNLEAAVTYVQIFDKQSGDVTVGTTVADWVLAVAASSQVTLEFPKPVRHTTGFSVASTTAADNDVSAGTYLTVTYGSK